MLIAFVGFLVGAVTALAVLFFAALVAASKIMPDENFTIDWDHDK